MLVAEIETESDSTAPKNFGEVMSDEPVCMRARLQIGAHAEVAYQVRYPIRWHLRRSLC
jgi:hypothetical protein